MKRLNEIYGWGLGILLVLGGVFLFVGDIFGSGILGCGFESRSDSIIVHSKALTIIPRRNYRPPRLYTPRKFRAVEINGATSGALISVYGIGEVLSGRIIEKRESLGGFTSLEQLQEVKGIDMKKIKELDGKIFVDPARIKKININFATRNTLVKHPYITSNMADRIIKGTKMKGVIVNNQQLIDNDILTPKEAKKLAPYLSYDTLVHQN